MPPPNKAVVAAAGSVAAALGSALCCAGPLVAIALGVSGAGIASIFEPWRPALVAIALAGLTYGHWAVWREERRACEPGMSCASPRTRRTVRWMLWAATVLAVPLMLFPWWSRFVFG